jgi:hypothetical protein
LASGRRNQQVARISKVDGNQQVAGFEVIADWTPSSFINQRLTGGIPSQDRRQTRLFSASEVRMFSSREFYSDQNHTFLQSIRRQEITSRREKKLSTANQPSWSESTIHGESKTTRILHGRRGKNKKDDKYQLLIRRISGLVKPSKSTWLV